MPRRRLYSSNAERQAAYRARLAVRQERPDTVPAALPIKQLEAALVAMTSRAESAERRAVVAERQAQIAVKQVRALKLSLTALQHQLEATAAVSSDPEPPTGINRQAGPIQRVASDENWEDFGTP